MVTTKAASVEPKTLAVPEVESNCGCVTILFIIFVVLPCLAVSIPLGYGVLWVFRRLF